MYILPFQEEYILRVYETRVLSGAHLSGSSFTLCGGSRFSGCDPKRLGL